MKKKGLTGRGKPVATRARKRKRGRPQARIGAVGKEAVVAAARELIDEVRPHQVTIALIARKAGVDPALVRYYFKTREHVLIAVVERILGEWATKPSSSATPADQLSAHLANLFEFSLKVRSMQRLMIEECAEAKSPEVRARAQELTSHVVKQLAGLIGLGEETPERSPDALYLHVAMIGLCEFFAAAQSAILPLAPAGVSGSEFASRYGTFIHDLVLDGVRKRLK